MTRRDFLRWTAAAGLGTAGVTAYTFEVEPHWVAVEERDLPVAGLPPALAGARLVQISDLHVGPEVSDDYLVGCLERVAALRPDILVVTGDFLTYSQPRGDAQFGQLRDVLAHLPQGRLATLGILGNHDYGRGWSEPPVAARVAAVAEQAGVRILRNDCATVEGLDAVGVDDLGAGRADPVRALDGRSGEAAVVLCHNPDTLDALPWAGYRGWILAGHTHGGQCKPPFLPPPLVPVRNRRYVAGEVGLDDGRRLYVNRGLGHIALQARFNARPEITCFTLQPA
ncbi:MAG: metallophosphoesterase [Acidobacteriota bacterium]